MQRRSGAARRIALLAAVLALLLGASPARAASNRFYFASQHDFGAKTGFYLDLENQTEGTAPCPLTSLRLIFGVGDGAQWRFLSSVPRWETGKTYVARGTVGPNGAALFLGDARLAQETGAKLHPAAGTLTGAERPAWASDAAEYAVRQLGLRVTINNKTIPIALPTAAEKTPLPVYLFEPQARVRRDDIHVPPGATLTVEATFRLEPYPTDLKPLAPFVDRFGQSRHADWPGKVEQDADLTRAADSETKRYAAWGKTMGYDAYGGYVAAGWREKPTGFFRVARRDDRWWLISPLGNPTFYIGLCTAPAVDWEKTPVTSREFLFAALPPRTGASTSDFWSQGVWGGDGNISYAAIHPMNLVRKYGSADWKARARQSLDRRLDAWGFSGQGKWCDPLPKTPWVPVLNRGGVPNLARHPDIFDPSVRARFAGALQTQIAPRKGDPAIVGWSLGNEYDEIITRAEIEEILQKHSDSAAARALKMAFPGGDIEQMRRHYATAYYEFVYKTVKAADPNHLYLGFWIVPGWWENEEDWRLIAPHCDVIGYDRYSPVFADEQLTRLMRAANKPVLCGEFSFPAFYDGTRGYGLYESAWARTDAESGDDYARWIADAARNPFCVGVLWFQYRDQPITGRGPGQGAATLVQGEHFAFGMVDIMDRPKWDLVTRVRRANLGAARLRAGKSAAGSK